MAFDETIRRAFHSIPAHDHSGNARHSLILIEHDPLLYENATGMIDLASQAMSDAAKEAVVLLYSREPIPTWRT